jgi:hypothetical protein
MLQIRRNKLEIKETFIDHAHNAIFGSYKVHLIKEGNIADYKMCVGSNGELIIDFRNDLQESEVMLLARNENVEVLIEGQLASTSGDDAHLQRFAEYYPKNSSTGSVRVFSPKKYIVNDKHDNKIENPELDLVNSFAGEVEDRMVEHMNDDHVDAIRDYCRYASIELGQSDPSMIGVDQYGFDVMVEDRPVRFSFDHVCKTPTEVREALVEMAKRSRA